MKVDFIIVGQGLAGTFLSWFLRKRGKTFFLIDERKESSASRVASGIIHPVTGRRIVKTWLADELIPFAEATYREVEIFLGEKFYKPYPVLELISTVKEYNDWLARSEELSSYIESSGVELYEKYLQDFFSKIVVKKSSRVKTSTLITAYGKFLSAEGLFAEGKFDPDQLKLIPEGVVYKNISADKIIFCEGVDAMQNNFWKHLPFIPSKGEVITFHADMQLTYILSRKIHILPEGDNLFRAGSTYAWEYSDEAPTAEGKDEIVAALSSILKIPFEVVEHKAAIRPTVKNRRPFLGLHKSHEQIGIFNGLGTKGCLLAPYFADHLAGFLCGSNDLMKEVDVRMLKSETR